MKITSIEDALLLLRVGGVIAYPTETFYGIGCSAYNEESLKRIYEIKGRELTSPLPLIVRDIEQALEVTDLQCDIENSFRDIANKFWPNSLSICLKASKNLSSIITAGTGTVVVRQSPSELATLLCKGLNAPLVSTSANKSGEKPARTAEEVDIHLAIDAILQPINAELEPKGGLPSTIIEILEKKQIRVLRMGAFNHNELEKIGYNIVK